ncbi:DMT family transporter [Roseospira goensis]|uniref:Drug/metabolite transporter (DMT)-like permease n=1 Tax=Roseospira goensis TaxID=391922 RepID=A0A7W6WLX7_9PROT|nr:DMT family transporter [Roseospira goensis]MBB4287535.1 drug/metabolite transporter (DMT)-like permease [Roseospira goensis]
MTVLRPSVAAPPFWSALPGNVRGGLLMLGSAAAFSVMAALIKRLALDLPTLELVFFRSAFQAAALLPLALLAARRGGPQTLLTRRPGLHGLRLLLGAVAVAAGFYAIAALPLATALSISFTRALFLTLLAVLVLREWVGPHRWAAVAVGFLGVVVILRPWHDNGGVDPALLAGLASAAAIAGMSICVRLLSRTEGNLVMMLYPALFTTAVFAIPTVATWQPPTALHWGLIVAMSACGGLGQFLLINAYRQAEPSAVAPMNYTQLLWAAAIGYVVFGEFPDAATWLGAGMILGAALYTLHRERRRGRPITAPGSSDATSSRPSAECRSARSASNEVLPRGGH